MASDEITSQIKNMIIKATGQLGSNRVINPVHKTFSFDLPINEKPKRCSFRTEDPIQEWDEVIVYEEDGVTKIFAGIAESVSIDRKDMLVFYSVSVGGYNRLFDRLRVNKTYNTPGQTIGDIVSDIIANFTEGFTDTNVAAGPQVDPPIQFNFELPSVAISKLARSVGYSWFLDIDRDVHLFEKNSNPGVFEISVANADKYDSLEFTPNVENFANVVTVRGGKELSTEQTVEFVADGVQTVFLLPEYPHDVSVEVDTGGGYAAVTLAPKFGEDVPTTQFIINYAEKYIENGTHALLAAGNKIKIMYKFEYPIRIQTKNLPSIAAMQALFPATNGEFHHVIDDDQITSRDLAKKLSIEYISNHANAEVDGSFNTYEEGFEEGQVLTINVPEFSGSAVIQKIKTKSIGGGVFYRTIIFATVLFDFEDFLRELLQAKKSKANDNDVVEILTNFSDEIAISDDVFFSKDENRKTDELAVSEELYKTKNKPIEYVLGPYFPVLSTPFYGDEVLYWKFDDGAGTTANDSGANNFDGTTVGSPSWGVGQFDGGLVLNGSSQYCGGPNMSSIINVAGEAAATISIWAKWDDYSQNFNIFSRALGDSLYPRIHWTLSTNTLNCQFRKNGVTTSMQISSFSSLYAANVLHHFALVLKDGSQILYIDGVPAISRTISGGTFAAGTNGARTGYDANLGYYLKGRVDEFRIYKRELSQDEVLELMTRSSFFDNKRVFNLDLSPLG